MRERIRDKNGFVWVRDENVGDWWHPEGEFCSRTRDEVEEDFGPIVDIDADGEPLNPAPADDVRALLADAFEDFSERLAPLISGAEFEIERRVYTALADVTEHVADGVKHRGKEA